ncbi:MAG: hypothetical protein QJR12_11780 [Mycobacterium sp.]|uniref:hypothetical protein n=1 Tax=Mycobacterium sp. TaxID=1785 RepID=UPI00261F1A37|nr:hypothetical protein [Mycobacterium sp.]MDI3314913.1 hypothetical protein [Mycobacterium sp.]
MTTSPHDPRRPETTRSADDTRTRIIRRAPTAPLPPLPQTAQVAHPPPGWGGPGGGVLRDSPADSLTAGTAEPAPKTVIAACTVSIVGGWATSVVATDLIAGWWKSDRLFCIAVGFLALVFGSATVAGVITLLQRRRYGSYLIVAGAVVALLTYLGVFIAGARVAWIVHTLPVLPIAAVVLALHPHTKRWVLGEQRPTAW